MRSSPKIRRSGAAKGPTTYPMGLRWPVERTNSWLSNYGQMRRNTDWLSSRWRLLLF